MKLGDLETVLRRELEGEATARFGPYALEPLEEMLGGALYQCAASRRGVQADIPCTIQVFVHIGDIGGRLWEHARRALLRVTALRHPGLPEVMDGGYIDSSRAPEIGQEGVAFAVTRLRAEVDVSSKEALVYFRSHPNEAFQEFSRLMHALDRVQSLRMFHRNLWPKTIVGEFDSSGNVHGLRLARFELSGLVSDVYRRGTLDALGDLQRLWMQEEMAARCYYPSERLQHIFDPVRHPALVSPYSDVYGLGVLAWQWFGAESDEAAVLDDVIESVEDGREVNRRLAMALRARRDLPLKLRDLMAKLIEWFPSNRLTPSDVVKMIREWQGSPFSEWALGSTEKPRLVMLIPKEFKSTLHAWGFLEHDPATDVGTEALLALARDDLRGAEVAYSSSGAEAFASGGDPAEKREARHVLIGREFAWFCRVYREAKPYTGELGPEIDEMAIIKYVVRRDRFPYGAPAGQQFRISDVDALAWGMDKRKLETMMVGRPSWRPVFDRVAESLRDNEWEIEVARTYDFLLDYQQTELDARCYPYRYDANARVLRHDLDREVDYLASYRMLSVYADGRRPGLTEFVESLRDEETVEGFEVVAGDATRPRFVPGLKVPLTVDRELVRLGPGQPDIPHQGWLRPATDRGSVTNLRRQRAARERFLETKVLLDQLHRPMSLPAIPQRWLGAGEDLLRDGQSIVSAILSSQPFFALQGPPGTGKTTVLARAITAYLREEPTARILVSAQSNDALDNLALRVLNGDGADDLIAIRATTPMSEGRVHGDMHRRRLGPLTDEWVKRIQRQTDVVRRDHALHNEVLDEVLREWAAAAPDASSELEHRLSRSANLVFATCANAGHEDARRAGDLGLFDWVVVEEAARAWLTELAIPLCRGLRWTLVGDHLQLPAYGRQEVMRFAERWSAEPASGLPGRRSEPAFTALFDLFAGLFEQPEEEQQRKLHANATAALSWQFRMRDPIGRVVGDTFYKGRLKTHRKGTRTCLLRRPALLAEGTSLIWVDTSDDEPGQCRLWYNPREAALVAELVGRMSPFPVANKHGFGPVPLVVLTPYRRQADVLKESLRGHLQAHGVSEQDSVQTVHQFQGREADIAVVSLVRDYRPPEEPVARRDLGHLSQPELVNVMLSRARELLVVVGSFSHFQSSDCDFWKQVCHEVAKQATIVPAARVREEIG